jgi:hypothetical protein
MTPDRSNDYAAELIALHQQMLERDAVFADCEKMSDRRRMIPSSCGSQRPSAKPVSVTDLRRRPPAAISRGTTG